jgi:hypothetical protein
MTYREVFMSNETYQEHAVRHKLIVQYKNVLLHPHAVTFRVEQEQAHWKSVWTQLILLGFVCALLAILNTMITPTPLAAISGMDVATERSVVTIATMLFIFVGTPISFFAIGGIVYGLCRIVHGQGTYLRQMYTLVLFGVPIVLLSSILQLIPQTSAWLPWLPYIYSIYLLGCSIIAVHSMRRSLVIEIVAFLLVLAVIILMGLLVLVLR